MVCIKCLGGFVGPDPYACGPCLRCESRLVDAPEGRIPIDYTSEAKPPEIWQEDILFAEAGKRAKEEGAVFMADVRAEDAEYFQD